LQGRTRSHFLRKSWPNELPIAAPSSQAYPVVKELLERLGSRVRLVFRNFPLAERFPVRGPFVEAYI
jgi:hypothetical protein